MSTIQSVAVVPQRTVDEIARAHEEALSLAERSLERALRVGELLHHVRSTFPKRAGKGEGFETWVESTLPFSGRMARNYIRAFEHRAELNLAVTFKDNLRLLAAPKAIPETGFRNDPDEVDSPAPTMEVQATWTASPDTKPLEGKDEAKAQELAVFFNVDVAKARAWVQAKKAKPKKTKRRAQDANKLVAVTVRFAPDEVDMMEAVARAVSKQVGKIVPLAQIAREHHRLGSTRFAKKYAEHIPHHQQGNTREPIKKA